MSSKPEATEAAVPSKSWLQAWWDGLRSRHSAVDIMLAGTFGIHVAAYWSTGLLLLLAERLMPRQMLLRYKTQPKRSVSNAEIGKLLKVVLSNNLLLLGASFLIRKLRPKIVEDRMEEMVAKPVPTVRRMALDYVFNLAVFEVVFYAGHNILHRGEFYKRIHKLHHEFKAPIALASEYAHPVELLLSNIVPGAVGPMLSGAHPISTWAWLVGSIVMTNIHHSGLYIPGYPFNGWTIAHDYHHAFFYSQFGVVGLMDAVMKTTDGSDFRGWKSAIVQRVVSGVTGGRLKKA